MRNQFVDLELLAVDRILGATNLASAGGVLVAAVERGELRFQPLTGWVLRLRKRGCSRCQGDRGGCER